MKKAGNHELSKNEKDDYGKSEFGPPLLEKPGRIPDLTRDDISVLVP